MAVHLGVISRERSRIKSENVGSIKLCVLVKMYLIDDLSEFEGGRNKMNRGILYFNMDSYKVICMKYTG